MQSGNWSEEGTAEAGMAEAEVRVTRAQKEVTVIAAEVKKLEELQAKTQESADSWRERAHVAEAALETFELRLLAAEARASDAEARLTSADARAAVAEMQLKMAQERMEVLQKRVHSLEASNVIEKHRAAEFAKNAEGTMALLTSCEPRVMSSNRVTDSWAAEAPVRAKAMENARRSECVRRAEQRATSANDRAAHCAKGTSHVISELRRLDPNAASRLTSPIRASLRKYEAQDGSAIIRASNLSEKRSPTASTLSGTLTPMSMASPLSTQGGNHSSFNSNNSNNNNHHSTGGCTFGVSGRGGALFLARSNSPTKKPMPMTTGPFSPRSPRSPCNDGVASTPVKRTHSPRTQHGCVLRRSQSPAHDRNQLPVSARMGEFRAQVAMQLRTSQPS